MEPVQTFLIVLPYNDCTFVNILNVLGKEWRVLKYEVIRSSVRWDFAEVMVWAVRAE